MKFKKVKSNKTLMKTQIISTQRILAKREKEPYPLITDILSVTI